jgi:hypothetical protein
MYHLVLTLPRAKPPTADGRSITGHTVSPSGTGRSPNAHLSHNEHDLAGWREAPLDVDGIDSNEPFQAGCRMYGSRRGSQLTASTAFTSSSS